MHLDIDDAVLGRARQIGSHHTEFCFGARHRPVTTTVFEYRKGTRPITPDVEAYIRQTLKEFGWEEEPRFTGYLEDYLW